MKKALSLFLIVLLCLSFAACGEEKAATPVANTGTGDGTGAQGDGSVADENTVVGSWMDTEGISWTFNADGTVVVTYNGQTESGTWTVSGNNITIVGGGTTTSGTYTIMGNVLTLTTTEGQSKVLRKNDSVADTTAATSATSAIGNTLPSTGATAANISELCGNWSCDGEGWIMVINANGTGTMDGDGFTWSVNGSAMTLVNNEDGDTITLYYGISGSTLSFFSEEGVVVMTFTKA